MNKSLFTVLSLVILAWFLFCLTLYAPKMLEYFFLPIITGIITTWLYIYYQKKIKAYTIKKELSKFEGEYFVYHWRDLMNRDTCNYKIVIKLDDRAAILKIHQTGNNDFDELVAEIKVDELTFSYGEGNYIHPQKQNTPTGRMQLFLIEEGIINVDKSYLDIKEKSIFLPGWEKWQWRKGS